MKKILFSFMAFLILILGSCQESSYVEDIQDESVKSNIIDPINKTDDGIVARLQAFNDSLAHTTASTNGINKGDLTRGLNIACADLFGVCRGVNYGLTYGKFLGPNTAVIAASILGPVIGAYSSYKASLDNMLIRVSYDECISSYIELKESEIDLTKHYPKRVVLNLPEDKQDIQVYGAKHNLLLDNLVKKRHSSTSIEDALVNNVLTDDEYNILTDSSIKKIFERPEIYNPENMVFGLGELCDNILSLYNKAVRTSSISYKNLETITNKYLSEVFSTQELDQDEADQLAACLCSFVSSSEYWKIYK